MSEQGKLQRRQTILCRSWLFVNGADEVELAVAPASSADVLIQDIEDFTLPALRPKARELSPKIIAGWRTAGAVAAVRINPLEGEGHDDIEAVMSGAPDIVALPKVEDPDQIEHLAMAITALEERYNVPPGVTEILPNIETARGLLHMGAIIKASGRIKACLMASEDLAADLGAERGVDGFELAYCRQRFLVECVAAGVLAIDYPFTWDDVEAASRDARAAKRLGYKAKSAVASHHAALINEALTPGADEVAEAERIVEAFEAGQAAGEGRVLLDGNLVEVPTYRNAKRVIDRARAMAGASGGSANTGAEA
jgi:citrate lyase subunit beta/citryl-CoA lyase